MRPLALKGEPRHSSRFTVGRDRTGHWVVTDRQGLCGGIFADRAAAVHYALEESDYDPGEVTAAPDGVTLSIDAVFARPLGAR